MKKKLIVFLTIFVLVFSMMSILAIQAAEDAEVKVVVNADGTITVTAKGTFEDGDWVGIYKEGETVDPNNGGAISLVWWYVTEETVVTYPGENEGITVNTQREEELSNGADSALAPGEYYAVVLGGTSSYEVFSEEFAFTIPESGDTPTEAPATATPTPEATATPTAKPTEKATTAPSTTKTAAPTAKATATGTAGETEGSSNTLLWVVCIVAAVIIIAAVIVIIVVKKKKK
ncbi:MAG: hypothetical protein ACLSVG_05380 [Clostridia bacterium]